MNKWKSKQTGRTIEVLGDDLIKGQKYRFFVWEDDPKQTVCQHNMVYGDAWEDIYAPLDNTVKV
jgi:hypothetical protein